jgi:hypothetical protein
MDDDQSRGFDFVKIERDCPTISKFSVGIRNLKVNFQTKLVFPFLLNAVALF